MTPARMSCRQRLRASNSGQSRIGQKTMRENQNSNAWNAATSGVTLPPYQVRMTSPIERMPTVAEFGPPTVTAL
jgi:hypothetical protein